MTTDNQPAAPPQEDCAHRFRWEHSGGTICKDCGASFAAAPAQPVPASTLQSAAQKFFDVTEELMSTEEMSPFSFASSMNDYMIAREDLLKALKG